MDDFKGFTLAEVLVTLGIIGVVATMTMPSLIMGYQKKQTAIQLKKAYSELYQAVKVAEKDYGTMDGWDFTDYSTSLEKTKAFAIDYLFPNIKIIKSCIPFTNECWADNVTQLAGGRIEDFDTHIEKGVSFITASGYSVYCWLHADGTGGWFWVDLNGLKKPNIVGKDVFPLLLTFSQPSITNCPLGVNTKLGLFPLGAACETLYDRDYLLNETRYACNKDNSLGYAGAFCGALIMFDGWEIKSDYPW